MAKNVVKAKIGNMPNTLTEEQFKALKPLTWVQVAWGDAPDSVGLVVSNDLLVSKPGYLRTTHKGISIINVTGDKDKEDVRFILGIDREQIRFVIGEVNRPRFLLDEVSNAQTNVATESDTKNTTREEDTTDTSTVES